MYFGSGLGAGLVRLTAKRYRRILSASIATLLASSLLLGLILFIRWHERRAVQSDTRTILTQTAQQLVRSLQSRRGTLTFLRDTLDRRPTLSPEQLTAMGQSAVDHTRHLLGAGMVQASHPPIWWAPPKGLSRFELGQVDGALLSRTQLRGVWRVASTFVATTKNERAFLLMLEPLRSPASRKHAIVGVFELKPLLEDFFATTLSARYPVQLLDGATRVYRSSTWQAAGNAPPRVERVPVTIDAARWTIEMQPGSTGVARTLSWFNLLLTLLSLIAGLGVIGIIWILAARAWLLERAVERRTAALRRATQRLRQAAITDELTGLYNRRFFLNRWEWEYERAKRYQRPLACLMIDVNGFKQVNDRLGHHTGDLVLQHIARELKTILRQSDILARFGGDEFIVALPETSPEQADLVAGKLRQIAIPIPVPDASPKRLPPLSLSVGMSRVEDDDDSSQEILEAADASLYADKRRVKPSST